MDAKLKFKCRKCGFCCSEEGYVFFSSDEIKQASTYLGMKEKEFVLKYLEKDNIGIHRCVVEKGSHCPFLVSNACIINPCKPYQCSTFPYWREYMDKDGNLLLSKFDRECPGVTEENHK